MCLLFHRLALLQQFFGGGGQRCERRTLIALLPRREPLARDEPRPRRTAKQVARDCRIADLIRFPGFSLDDVWHSAGVFGWDELRPLLEDEQIDLRRVALGAT